MLVQLLSLYDVIAANKQKFIDAGLNGDFFIDIYRSQPFQPDQYEYFSLPAIFVDYSMSGNGAKKPRTVDITLHIVTDELPDASNITPNNREGLNKLLYNLILQQILDGIKLKSTSPLQFVSEIPVVDAVTEYHTQTYRFDAYLYDMIGTKPSEIIGQFDRLNIFGSLKNR